MDGFGLANRKITDEEFYRLSASLELTDKQTSRAYRVLVKRMPVKQVADQDKVSDETVRSICRRVAGTLIQSLPILTQEHFDSVIATMSRMTERNIKLAKRVLVDGEKLPKVAKSAGLKASTLRVKVNKIRDKAMPEDWVYVYGILPKAKADEIEAVFQNAFKDYIKL